MIKPLMGGLLARVTVPPASRPALLPVLTVRDRSPAGRREGAATTGGEVFATIAAEVRANRQEPPPAPSSGPTAPAPAPLDQLWPVLVRRVAWEGDGHRGAVHLELGAGALSGATVTLSCEADGVHVRLSVPAGVDLDGWRQRIASRLAAAGLPLVDVE